MRRLLVLVATGLWLGGCGDDTTDPGGVVTDAAADADRGGGDGEADVAAPALDGSPADDATPLRDAGAPGDARPDDGCALACEIVLGCAVQVCPAAGEEEMAMACALDCAGDAAFATAVEEANTCDAVFALATGRGGAMATLCGPNSGAAQACAAVAGPYAVCLEAVCPHAAALGDEGLIAFTAGVCENAIADGLITVEIAQMAVGTPCGEGVMQIFVAYLVDPPGGLLAGLCADGPRNPDVVCQPACALIGRCIPEGTPEDMGGRLRDTGYCRYACGTQDALDSATWECLSMTEGCGDAFGCIH
jgi:hypothetical protein